MKTKRSRVIEQLRETYPGPWVYDREFSEWRSPTMTVKAYAQLAPRHDSDDETFITIYLDDNGRHVINPLMRYL